MSGQIKKGSMRRTVEAPGFHIHSKYDLKGLRTRLHDAKAKGNLNVNLPLTPMIDMMSILIIFLLMNFSATGEVFFINKDSITLPRAAHARPLENGALISITKDAVIFETQKVGENSVAFEERNEDLPQLKARLQQLRLMDQQIHPDKPFKGQVNIQADKETPLLQIKRVMNVLISEGWTGINFAVEQGRVRNPAADEAAE